MNLSTSSVLSVSDLNAQARTLLESHFNLVKIEGEISNLARPSSGHLYFTLKDAKAQVRAAMFRNRAQFLRTLPKEGDRVQVTARVSLYEGRGDFQLICEQMAPAGQGDLQQAFEALRQRLAQAGLFDVQHKRPLPKFPHHLGIITSPSGAAIHDILQVLQRRYPGLPITLFPSAVQGSEAPAQLIRALQQAQTDGQCDVLILGRGGGSLEDLWAFNNEHLAQSIFACKIPIISAVGHEVDVTIADLVADIRAATPSAAAELVSPDQQVLQRQLRSVEQALTQQMQRHLLQQRTHLQHLRKRLRHPGDRLREQSQRLDQLELRLGRAIQSQLDEQRIALRQLELRLKRATPEKSLLSLRQHLNQLEHQLRLKMHEDVKHRQLRFQGLLARLNSVSPLATLERGYSILRNDQQELITSVKNVSAGDILHTQLCDGTLRSQVLTLDTPSSNSDLESC